MPTIAKKQFITDDQGNPTAVIIDIKEYNRIQKLLKEKLIPSNLKPEPVSETDPDNEIFKNRAHEKSIPLSQCNDITEKLKKLDIS